MGADDVRVNRFVSTSQQIEVDLERDIAVDKGTLPIWVRALLRESQTLRHQSLWRRISAIEVVAEIDISLRRLPIHAHGTGTISQVSARGSRMHADWRVFATVPTLGDAAQRLFAEQVRTALDDDYAFTIDYLRGVAPVDGRSGRRGQGRLHA